MDRGGCLGEADRQLGEGLDLAEVQGAPELAQDVNFGSYSRSLQNERVMKAFREWSECMDERGYDLSTPRDAPNEYLPADFDVADGQPPSEEEVEMALWDVECQERSGSTETWFEVESEIQREMIEEQAEAFEQLAAENEELLRRAAEVLESAGE